MNKADAILARLDRIIELLTPAIAPTAQIETPARCQAFDESQCALRSDDAKVSKASFGDPFAWSCKGCRIRYVS